MRGMQKVLPIFQEQNSGIIINLASIAGLQGGRGGVTYIAAKHVVAGMTKNVGSHYGPSGIRCNAIRPCSSGYRHDAISRRLRYVWFNTVDSWCSRINASRCIA